MFVAKHCAHRLLRFPVTQFGGARYFERHEATLDEDEEDREYDWVRIDGVFVKGAKQSLQTLTSSSQSLPSNTNQNAADNQAIDSNRDLHLDEESESPSENTPAQLASFDSRQNSWSSILATLKASANPPQSRFRQSDQNKKSLQRDNHHYNPNIVVKPGIITATSRATTKNALKISLTDHVPWFEHDKQKNISINFPEFHLLEAHKTASKTKEKSWSDSLDFYYNSWKNSESLNADQNTEFSTLLNSLSSKYSPNALAEMASKYFYPNYGTKLFGKKAREVWQAYSIISNRAPKLWNSLTQKHYENIVKATLLSFLPTNPAAAESVPHFLNQMFHACSHCITLDMKRREVALNAVIYSGLYRANIADPRKAIATHEFIRRQMNAKDKSNTLISDESIRTLIGVLLYGGGENFQHFNKNLVMERKGPFMTFRNLEKNSSEETHPFSKLDMASMIEDLWQDLQTFSIKLSMETFMAFIDAFGMFREKNMVETVHERLAASAKKEKLEFTEDIYCGLMVAHERCENFSAVVRLFDDLEAKGLPINR
ncbi:hypothetical protein HK100_009881 [Physocladia obscura]|uniref:Uncharacterized protein n=1 Tax=Physocladia obscura TaxID=109957 RepID=A0AAD5X9J3_9FUNG|nr:hypothetical protein HK100_009881 [Physocladia obscura]